MSGENVFSSTTLQPIVEALQGAITVTDIVNLFTSGVVIALPLILVWFGARWVSTTNMPIKNYVNAWQSGVLFSANEGSVIAISCQDDFRKVFYDFRKVYRLSFYGVE